VARCTGCGERRLSSPRREPWGACHNFGEQWVPLLWEVYGLDSVDEEKIESFTLLDELY
jgi:hypothetical protein